MGKNKKQRSEQPLGAMDELSMELEIRKRYRQNWPSVVLNLTKRIQAVNQTWAKAVRDIMRIDGLQVRWYQKDGKFHIEIRIGDKVEHHEIDFQELQDAHQYIEVLLMDKVQHSKLIAEHLSG